MSLSNIYRAFGVFLLIILDLYWWIGNHLETEYRLDTLEEYRSFSYRIMDELLLVLMGHVILIAIILISRRKQVSTSQESI